MLRNALAAVAALALVGVLAMLVVQSRAVDSEYYVTYGNSVNLLRQSQNELATLEEGLQTAFREGRPVPAATAGLVERLASRRDELSATVPAADDAAIASTLSGYTSALDESLAAARRFLDSHAQLAESASVIRSESPLLVRDLRSFGLEELSQDVFALAVGALDFAGGGGETTAETIRSRIAELESDPAAMDRVPGKLDRLAEAARTLTAVRDPTGAALAALADTQASDRAQALFAALRAHNRAVVGSADRARLMLAVLSLLLLASIAFVGWRLHQSYRVLNSANAELEVLNASLEERVEARTEQLTKAYEELKESQSQLVHAEKMSSLGELVAGISHEINTPLWYLLSNATLLKERLEHFDQFAAEAGRLLEQLRNGRQDREAFVASLRAMDRQLNQDGLRDDLEESVDLVGDSIEGLEQLAEMAQSLKDFSRLDRATVGEFNVNEGLDKSLLIAKNVLKHKVNVEKDYGDVPTVRCAPSQINQVFLNLIKNAADAIEGEGKITLSTRHEDGHVLVSIADTGSGIPEDVMTKIRDPFFTTKEVGQGTGLGLSIVDKIITAHMGELVIESEPGQGSVFTVKLPVEAMGDADAANESTDQATARPRAAAM
ncbi:ATP-binding protein [Lentisalinibacter sediminis]|uniref:ATP-binding protein n=1 Tax=Lentisalinibacter sediminis TaxID=2992237 RepID=UPI003869D145